MDAEKQPCNVTLVTSTRCHLCERARSLLDGLADRYHLDVREVALESDEGAAIVRRWRVPHPPILLIDGDLHGYGRISARRLEKDLSRRAEQKVG
jgi:glutaredoxin